MFIELVALNHSHFAKTATACCSFGVSIQYNPKQKE